MVLLSSISFVIYMSANLMATFAFLIPLIKTRADLCVPLSNFWNKKALSLQANITNHKPLSNFFWWKVTFKKGMPVICVGVRNQWKFKNQTLSIVNTKAQIVRLGFTGYILRVCKNRGHMDDLYSSIFRINMQPTM
jgi:hypothetical protein